MKTFLRVLILAATPLLFTSCLDIIEDIFVKKDGSGTYKLTLTISEKARMMMTQNQYEPEEDEEDDFNPVGSGTDLKENFEALGKQIQSVKGISNYQSFSNEANLEFGYSFDFDDIETLNRCMELAAGSSLGQMPGVMGKGKKQFAPTARYIEWNKKNLVRHQSAELAKIMDMKNNQGSNAGMMGGIDVSYMFQDMRYKCTYTFEESFKNFSNEAAEAGDGLRSLSLTCFPFASTPADEKQARLAAEACSQQVVISFK